MREICVLIFRVKDGRGVDVSFGLVSREYLLTCGWFGKHSLVYVGVRTEHCANISGLVAFILSRRSISTCWCSFLTFRPKILQNTGSGKKDIHNSQAQLNYWYLNLGWAISLRGQPSFYLPVSEAFSHVLSCCVKYSRQEIWLHKELACSRTTTTTWHATTTTTLLHVWNTFTS